MSTTKPAAAVASGTAEWGRASLRQNPWGWSMRQQKREEAQASHARPQGSMPPVHSASSPSCLAPSADCTAPGSPARACTLCRALWCSSAEGREGEGEGEGEKEEEEKADENDDDDDDDDDEGGR